MQEQPFLSEHMIPHYDEHDQGYPHPHMHDRERTRSPGNRRSSTRRPSVGARQFSNLEDSVNELHEKLDRFHLSKSDSSEGTYDGDDRWSQDDFRDFTPPASPRNGYPRRSRSTTHQPKYRSTRYNDAQVAIYRPTGRDYFPETRRRLGRAQLHQTRTHDDYPLGGPIMQRPQLPRRATESGGYDFADPMRDHRRSIGNYDYSQGWDGRRDGYVDGGRQNYHGGGNGFGY